MAAWAAQYCAQFDRADLQPTDAERFEAHLQVGELGPLRFARLACGGSAIDRKPVQATTGTHASAHSYTVIVQVSGTGAGDQRGIAIGGQIDISGADRRIRTTLPAQPEEHARFLPRLPCGATVAAVSVLL